LFGLSWWAASVDNVSVDDVAVDEVWARLGSDPSSVLIDVRTQAEWTFVGLPDLSSVGKRVMTFEWQSFPDNRVDPAFVEELASALDAAGVKKDSELFFICRSGARSRMAAEAMAAAGYSRCRNVADGFEGPLDADRHRGRVAGWKAAGLSWVQG
jgi:rhodanese-related sulfurtransferase